MDYYKLSEEPLQAAKMNSEQGLYRIIDVACRATLDDLHNRFNT